MRSDRDTVPENALEQKQPKWGHRDIIFPPGLPLCMHVTH